MSFPVNSENKVKFITEDPIPASKPAAGRLILRTSSKAVAPVKKKKVGVEVLGTMKSLNIGAPKKDLLEMRPLKKEPLPLTEVYTANIAGVVTTKNPLAMKTVKKIDKDFYNTLVQVIEHGSDSLDLPRVYLDVPEVGKAPAERVRMNRHFHPDSI